MSKYDERVMCIRTEDFEEVGAFQGFQPEWSKYLVSLLSANRVVWLPRGECETNPAYKQIIPYVAMACRTAMGVLLGMYQRTKDGGESRLHGKWACGVGGHINTGDRESEDESAMNVFSRAWQRELSEEVKIDCRYDAAVQGLLYDGTDAVGQVHLGVFMLANLQFGAAYPNNEEISQLHFAPLRTWLHAAKRNDGEGHVAMEGWTKLVLQSKLMQDLGDEPGPSPTNLELAT